MKVKYDAEADILIFILRYDFPYNAISQEGGVIVSFGFSLFSFSFSLSRTHLIYETSYLLILFHAFLFKASL